jgi:hypothetical protein
VSRAAIGARYAAAVIELHAASIDLAASDALTSCHTGFSAPIDFYLLKHGVFAMVNPDGGKTFDTRVRAAMDALAAG